MGSESPKKTKFTNSTLSSHHLSNYEIIKEIIKIKKQTSPQKVHYLTLTDKCSYNAVKDRALGCLFGSFIGDSLGSYCEFSKTISEQTIEKVMKMPGGGVFATKAGQFTDDSQLSAHLLHALNSLTLQKSLEDQQYNLIKTIAMQYVKWLQSQPFDLGQTCRKGIKKLQRQLSHYKDITDEIELQIIFQKIFNMVDKQNKDSQSNGSLMRITPMAVLLACAGIKASEHQTFIKNQIRLVHPNHTIQHAGFLWVDTLARIIKRDDSKAETFKTIYNRVEEMDRSKQLQDWFSESKKEEKMSGTINIGWSKIAWSYGMGQLYKLSQYSVEHPPPKLDQQYYKAIIQTIIVQAGDTDTNAAIVGGLLGALVGFSNLPSQYIQKMLVLQFEDDLEQVFEESAKRSHFYEPFNVLLEALDFVQKCGEYYQKNKLSRTSYNQAT